MIYVRKISVPNLPMLLKKLIIHGQVVVIGDTEGLNDIPGIVGLLAYSKENQTLHMKTNNSWKSLPHEDKVGSTDQWS